MTSACTHNPSQLGRGGRGRHGAASLAVTAVCLTKRRRLVREGHTAVAAGACAWGMGTNRSARATVRRVRGEVCAVLRRFGVQGARATRATAQARTRLQSVSWLASELAYLIDAADDWRRALASSGADKETAGVAWRVRATVGALSERLMFAACGMEAELARDELAAIGALVVSQLTMLCERLADVHACGGSRLSTGRTPDDAP